MLSHLKQWIFSGAGQRSNRRRNRLARFRGQIERLEPRTVLSASIGPMPAEIEIPVYSVVVSNNLVTVWESDAVETAWQPPHAPLGIAESHWEDYRPLALNGSADAPAMLHGPDSRPTQQGLQIESRPTYLVTVMEIVVPRSQWMAQSNLSYDPMGPYGKPLRATSPLYDEPNEEPDSQLYKSTAPPDYSRFAANLFPPSATETSVTRSTTATSFAARDAVLQDFASPSLLLTASVKRSTDKDADVLDDDSLESDHASSVKMLGFSDLDSQDDVAVSLDALKRERAAIDAALSELHDVKSDTADTSQDAARTADRQNPAAKRETEENYIPAGEEETAQSATNQDGGGMVLLATSGDANSSAYDLSAVILSGLKADTRVPLRVEASVGIYQAFDYGQAFGYGGELLPAANAATPTAQGAPTVRPGVSAESAPANKSEQPS